MRYEYATQQERMMNHCTSPTAATGPSVANNSSSNGGGGGGGGIKTPLFAGAAAASSTLKRNLLKKTGTEMSLKVGK